jgi:hypothetical protein
MMLWRLFAKSWVAMNSKDRQITYLDLKIMKITKHGDLYVATHKDIAVYAPTRAEAIKVICISVWGIF